MYFLRLLSPEFPTAGDKDTFYSPGTGKYLLCSRFISCSQGNKGGQSVLLGPALSEVMLVQINNVPKGTFGVACSAHSVVTSCDIQCVHACVCAVSAFAHRHACLCIGNCKRHIQLIN